MGVRRALWVLGLVVGAAALLSACHGQPHTFTVTTTADGADANPGDGVCEVTPGFGDCSGYGVTGSGAGAC